MCGSPFRHQHAAAVTCLLYVQDWAAKDPTKQGKGPASKKPAALPGSAVRNILQQASGPLQPPQVRYNPLEEQLLRTQRRHAAPPHSQPSHQQQQQQQHLDSKPKAPPSAAAAAAAADGGGGGGAEADGGASNGTAMDAGQLQAMLSEAERERLAASQAALQEAQAQVGGWPVCPTAFWNTGRCCQGQEMVALQPG